MKYFFLLSFFLISSALLSQEIISLNGTWQFKVDLYDQGLSENWEATNYPTADWDEMKVPGNWDLKNEYADFFGTAWYRKDFEAPTNWRGKAIRLDFQSVYNDVEVWLNGEKIGEHHIGFLPFQFDIGENVKIGTRNTIALRVNNVFKRGAIWNWGGIRRPVQLEITEPIRIDYQHITATPDLQNGTANVGGAFQFNNLGNTAGTVEYQWVLSKEGEELWRSEKEKTTVVANQIIEKKLATNFSKDQVKLWHFNDPQLYHSELVLFQNGKEIQRVTDRFGIRKVEVDGLKLKLNGETIRPVGFNVVAEDRTTGNTLPLWRIKEDVDMLKELGVNMARLNHLPLPKEYLDCLDEAGIMTFEEVSLWGKDRMVDPEHPVPKYWLEKMVKTKFNHPSVIGWSVGNEIGEYGENPKVMEYVEGAIKHSKRLDPTRLAVYVTHSADKQKIDPVEFSDLIMLNKYGNWGKNAENAHRNHPGKPIFYSEFGKALSKEDPNEGYVAVDMMMGEILNREYVIGASYWTFNDYRSFWSKGPGKTTAPSQNRAWGIVNTFRQKKRAYYDFRRYHAPVKSMKVEQKDNTLNFSISPRSVNEFPAHPMRDYQLVWTVQDDQQNVKDGGILALPELLPGDGEWQKAVNYKPSKNAETLKLALLDPQDYSVLDTCIHFSIPSTPNIKSTHSAINKIRIVYDKVPNAKYYKARYGEDSLTNETPLTINDFVEITDLEFYTSYQVQIVAVNEKGESIPTKTRIIATDEDELPPIIWNTVPNDQSFFIGYSVDYQDYLYEIEYGTESGNYSKKITLSNVGVLQVPNLQNGETYYYRFRRRMQWGFASEWSHEIKVTPDHGISPAAPKVYGAIKKDDGLLLYFKPVKKSTGYELKLTDKTTGVETIHQIKTAQSEYAMISNLKGLENCMIAMRSLNEFGNSTWVSID